MQALLQLTDRTHRINRQRSSDTLADTFTKLNLSLRVVTVTLFFLIFLICINNAKQNDILIS